MLRFFQGLFSRRVTLALAFTAVLAVPIAGARAEGSLADAYAIIAGKRFVDLTHAFGPETPVWAGFGQAIFSASADPKTREPYTIAKDGFHATVYSMVGQYGTHIDPPAHFNPNGATMDAIPVSQMILPLVVIDETPLLTADPSHALTVEDIAA
jgi:kynurenine formamidase